MDVLNDLLSTMNMRGDVYFRCAFTAPWGMRIAPVSVAEFHIVVQGACCIQVLDRPDPVVLQAGDVVLFPHGQAHVLLDAPDTTPAPAHDIVPQIPSNYGPVVYGGGGVGADIICGYFEFDRGTNRALLEALPQFVHVQGQAIAADFPWLNHTLHFIAHETGHPRHGTEGVVNRLVEVMFIQIMRAYIASQPHAGGLLGAIADPRLGRALAALHRRPETPWRLEDLADVAGMSRSAFAAGFQSQVGQSPMQYLTAWRMGKAATLLTTTVQGLADIAEQCGYTSPVAFAKAFKRHFGVGPGRYRKGLLDPS
ncbi:MAG: AraC family transcriptional regulator [Alphaproteobacteria bacterium CG_4_10_14_0_2_um_filter_63_37]|nr:MAG: AraC family transcriptional regulator [Alphaproteobacteria bacterium CG_4_10_14_0_2_um_filter_63_37]